MIRPAATTVNSDPYHLMLGISPADQPHNHYRLLGLSQFENDPNVIESAADRQMAHVRTYQSGPHSDASQQLLNEISAARICLLDPAKKASYDEELELAPSQQRAPANPLPTAARFTLSPPPRSQTGVRATPQPTRARRRRAPRLTIPILISSVVALVVILLAALMASPAIEEKPAPPAVPVPKAVHIEPSALADDQRVVEPSVTKVETLEEPVTVEPPAIQPMETTRLDFALPELALAMPVSPTPADLIAPTKPAEPATEKVVPTAPPEDPDTTDNKATTPSTISSGIFKTELAGGLPVDTPFQACPRDNWYLIGLFVSTKDHYGNTIITAVQPIFGNLKGKRQAWPKAFGKVFNPLLFHAKKGWAVEKILVRNSTRDSYIDGLQIVFRPLKRGSLELDTERDPISTPWIGGTEGEEITLGGNDYAVLGIHGTWGADCIDTLGLYLTSQPENAK